MNSYGWVCHHSGGVGLRSERPGITGTMGPSTSWDQWPRPVTRAVVGAQECTQIGQNGLSAPFWGVCVHCCAVGLGCGWPWDRNSVHKWEDRAPRRRFGAFVYTVATRVAIRIATRAAPGGTSASTTMACRRRLLTGPSRLVGKTDSERVAPLPGWHLRRGRQPTQTPEEPDVAPHSEKRSSRMMPRQVEGTVTRRESRGPEQS